MNSTYSNEYSGDEESPISPKVMTSPNKTIDESDESGSSTDEYGFTHVGKMEPALPIKYGHGHGHGCGHGRGRRGWGRQKRVMYKHLHFADIESPKLHVNADITEDWRKSVKSIHGLIRKDFDRKKVIADMLDSGSPQEKKWTILLKLLKAKVY